MKERPICVGCGNRLKSLGTGCGCNGAERRNDANMHKRIAAAQISTQRMKRVSLLGFLDEKKK